MSTWMRFPPHSTCIPAPTEQKGDHTLSYERMRTKKMQSLPLSLFIYICIYIHIHTYRHMYARVVELAFLSASRPAFLLFGHHSPFTRRVLLSMSWPVLAPGWTSSPNLLRHSPTLNAPPCALLVLDLFRRPASTQSVNDSHRFLAKDIKSLHSISVSRQLGCHVYTGRRSTALEGRRAGRA